MPNLPSLPEKANLFDVFRRFPKGLTPLLEFHDSFLREDDSDWTVAEREMIAAYVSGINQCDFCFGAHKLMAQAFGFSEEAFEQLMTNLDTANLSHKLKVTLNYVEKLTKTPSRMTPEDAQKVLSAGVSEEALYDAICICGAFNMMNRIVEATGVVPTLAHRQASSDDLERRRKNTYLSSAQNANLLSS